VGVNSDLDIWWSAYLATMAAGRDQMTARSRADSALEDYKRKAAELEAEDGR